jgi:hypothetical protein
MSYGFLVLLFRVHLIHAHAYVNHDTWQSYTFLTKRNVCPIYKAYI